MDPGKFETDPAIRRSVVDVFFAAFRDGDLDILLTLLHPGITFHADGGAIRLAASATVRGTENVTRRAATFAAPGATFQPITVNGSAAVIVRINNQPVSIMILVITHGRVAQVHSLLDQPRVEQLINGHGEEDHRQWSAQSGPHSAVQPMSRVSTAGSGPRGCRPRLGGELSLPPVIDYDSAGVTL